MVAKTKEEKEAAAREKEAQEQAIKQKAEAEAKAAAEAEAAKNAPLNPDAKKIEAGNKKVAELEKQEEELVSKLFSVREEKSKAIRAIQGSTKQASLGQCRAQMKRIEPSAYPILIPPVQAMRHPMLPGSLSADEMKAQKQK